VWLRQIEYFARQQPIILLFEDVSLARPQFGRTDGRRAHQRQRRNALRILADEALQIGETAAGSSVRARPQVE
jgi:hypothetical protein